MEQIKECKYEEVNFIWVKHFYDINLEGLCKEENETCYFEVDFETEKVTIYKFSLLEKFSWLFQKKLFEWCVGYHFSYKNGEKRECFKIKKPFWFWKLIIKLYYKF